VQSKQELEQNERKKALEELNYLLTHETQQTKKYGSLLKPNSDFLCRHEMVQSFLNIQSRGNKYPGKTRRDLATIVASIDDWGEGKARSIVQWEISWVKSRCIPESKAGKNKHTHSWMDDEKLQLDLREYAMSQGEGNS
jgi:hypothetical protein